MAISKEGAASGAASGAVFGPWGALIGGVAGAFLGKQKAPDAATYKPVDVVAEQARVTQGNLANFDSAATLSKKTNDFTSGEANRLMEQAIPGFSALRGKLMDQVNSDLNGDNMPADVQAQISKFAAEKGVSRGTSGQFNGFNLVKDFGFNLMDWRNASRARALNTLSTVYGMAPKVNIMSPLSSMVDPNTGIQAAGNNNRMQFEQEQAKLNADAAAGNENRSMLAGVMSAAGAIAGGQMDAARSRSSGIQSKASGTPVPSMSSGASYKPLAGASAFKLPGQ